MSYSVVEFCKEHGITGLLVEIGTYTGASAKMFAQNGFSVVTIDPYIGKYDDDDSWISNSDFTIIRNKFLEEIKGQVNIIPIIARSVTTSLLFEDEFVDVVYIDGSHTYQDCFDDITAWYPKVRKGGAIVGHDYGFQTVKDAVAEYSRIEPNFKMTLFGDIWTVIK